ncbi:MAG: hypothetical protein HY819_23350 [Acidobacteria bacterium]|nr:hypothetical protein [Acidobacteriota bacterium]
MVIPNKAKGQIADYKVKYVDINGYDLSTNGKQIDPVIDIEGSCLGVAIAHGGVGGWKNRTTEKYMFYRCFSSFKFVSKRKKVRRGTGSYGSTPKPKGDYIFLELETGGTQIVYWDGKTYKGFRQRDGD